MNALGRHILSEMYGCEAGILDNREEIERAMVNAALGAGAEVREVAFHKFSPQGVSGVVVISESHLAIHTWPELGYAAVDVFTCGDTVNPWDACNLLAKELGANHVEAQEKSRGNLEKIQKYYTATGKMEEHRIPIEPKNKTETDKSNRISPVYDAKIDSARKSITGGINIKPSRLILHLRELQRKILGIKTIGA